MKKQLLLLATLATISSLHSQPWFTIIPQNQCFTPSSMYSPTVVITATVGGATSYSWTVMSSGCTPTMYPNSMGVGGVVASPCTGTVTVTGYALNGTSTITSQTSTIVINSAPAVNISASPNNGTACMGTTFTLVNTGANAGNSYTTYGSGSFFTGSVAVITPSASTWYTVVATAPSGCTASAVQFLNLTAPPSLTISGPSSGCGMVNLISSGAQSYTWSNLSTNSMQTLSASGCYTVLGSTSACVGTSSAVACVTVNPIPAIQIAGNNTVCLGSSFTFTSSGALSYTWSNGPITNTATGIPTTNTTFTVLGTNAFGCVGSTVTTVYVDSTCADVWPGDANSDGTVSNLDVLELGLFAGSTGASRSGASNNWVSQHAGVWTGLNSNGKNRVHVDCNGNGTVSAADTAAISQNFSLNHAFKVSAGSSSGSDIALVPQGQYAYPGTWNKMDVIAGSSASPFNGVYGLAFDVSYNGSALESNQIRMVHVQSFLNAGNQTIDFGKRVDAAQKVYVATVRTDQTNVSGHGKIGEVWFRVPAGVQDDTPVQLGIANAVAIDANGVLSELTSGNATMLVSNNVSGLAQRPLDRSVMVFPNPAKHHLMLGESNGAEVKFAFTDVTGREVLQGSFSGQVELDVTSFAKGLYLVTFEANGSTTQRKVVIAD